MGVRLRPTLKKGPLRASEFETAELETEPEPTGILPGVCPDCQGPGILDHINLARETKTQTCRTCRHRWESPIG